MNASRSIPFLVTVVLALAVGAPALAAPDLTVRIDGQPVQSNADVVFSDVQVGGTDQIVVVLRNEGNEDLVFTEVPPVMLSGGFPDQFALVPPALESGNKLSPNGSTAFAVRFEPTIHFASLFSHIYLWTNASATPFHLRVVGRSTAGVLEVRQDGTPLADGTVVDFAGLASGATDQLVFVVRNAGDATLEFLGDPIVELTGSDAALFTLIPPALEAGDQLSPGGSTAFAIRLVEPLTSNRVLDAALTILSTDLDGAFELVIAGDVVSGDETSWGAVKARY